MCLTTVSFRPEAHSIAKQLLDESLAACIQIEGPIHSHYSWKGESLCDEEYRLVIKSSQDVWERLKTRLSELSPYDEPQIMMFDAADASAGYEQWVLQATKPSDDANA